MTKPYGHAFADYGERRPEVVCITNDLTASSEADLFRARFPERTFSLGMAEQNLVGVLGGFAREGFIPFYPTFSVFASRRPYEQVAMAVAYPALPVRVIGFLPGLSTPGGVTHQATDDVALMTQLPNMTVLEVGDATEAASVLDAIDAIDGPVFCRMLRGEVPVLFDTPFRLGRCRELRDGGDVLLLSSGMHTQIAMAAADRLADAGVSAGHVHVSTLKPFDDPILTERVATADHVITTENHQVRGGLGTAVAELIAERGLGTRLHRVGIRDTFTHGGTRAYLFRYYGLDEDAIIAAAGEALGRDLRSATAETPTGARHHDSVAEGL